MPTNGHYWCPEPTRGTCQSAILRSCFGVSPGCQCSAVPHQASGPTAALWTPPTSSYSAMVSSTETTASTSAAGVTPLSHLPPRGPATEPMDTLPPPTTKNLLATAGVGRGRKPRVLPPAPTAPGLRQMRPKMPCPQTERHPQCQPRSRSTGWRG